MALLCYRDIKAANIFWCADGSFKLGDFGVAKDYTATIKWGEQLELAVQQKYPERTDKLEVVKGFKGRLYSVTVGKLTAFVAFKTNLQEVLNEDLLPTVTHHAKSTVRGSLRSGLHPLVLLQKWHDRKHVGC